MAEYLWRDWKDLRSVQTYADLGPELPESAKVPIKVGEDACACGERVEDEAGGEMDGS